MLGGDGQFLFGEAGGGVKVYAARLVNDQQNTLFTTRGRNA
jgi:hypothetical protein